MRLARKKPWSSKASSWYSVRASFSPAGRPRAALQAVLDGRARLQLLQEACEDAAQRASAFSVGGVVLAGVVERFLGLGVLERSASTVRALHVEPHVL